MDLSTEQRRIVDAPSGNILVSAAAGSGKTTVMTERIVKRILDRELSVEHVLVMTFTNAAAANMSAKLDKRLREKLSETKDKETRKYLSEQIAALPSAYISTIDSFCSRVISNFSAQGKDEDGELLIEPKSMILDEVHANKLLMESFDEVFSEAYGYARKMEVEPELKSQEMPHLDKKNVVGVLNDSEVTGQEWKNSFLSMVSSFGSGRDDTDLKTDMAEKLSFLRSLPEYESWVKDALWNKRRESRSFINSHLFRDIRRTTNLAIRRRLGDVSYLRKLIPDVPFVKNAKTNTERQNQFLEWCIFLEENSTRILNDESMTWNEICALKDKVPDEKLPSYSVRSDDPELLEFDSLAHSIYELAYILTGIKKTKTFADSMKDEIRYFFGKTEEEITEELQSMYPLYERYFEMVLSADRLYQQKKRLEHGMDFPDQEQVALKLLSHPEVAEYYRDLFDEIYIDEYQDNSGVQDAIVQSFSKENVFFVGDVKQSIYRFRHAKPKMFLDRYDDYEAEQEGTLFTLNANYRSVPGILRTVNTIFESIMSLEYGDIEYDDSHALHPGRAEESYETSSGADVTLILAEDDKGSSDDDFGLDSDTEQILDMKEAEKVEKETLIVAKKISELKNLSGFSYDQCVILTTSNRGAMAAADILMKCGIPAQGPSLGNILTQPDLRVMIDLARLTENIYQDIPLAGVMKSKIRQANFTDRDLLEIYLFFPKEHDLPFCEKVIRFAKEDTTELGKKVSDFLSFINDLRTLAMQMTVTKWLEHVYAVTGYPSYIQSLEDGDARYYALMVFVGWATRFDMGRKSGLSAFVSYIDELDQGKDKSTEIDLSEPLENVVRCMTIHKSKGLEFPYVFLCGIQSVQKSRDTNLILSEDGDIAGRRYLKEVGAIYEPHDFYLQSLSEQRASDAEKIRLLYVALTRAEKKVFVISLVKRKADGLITSCEPVITAAEDDMDKFAPELMCKLKSHLNKCMAGLVRIPGYPLRRAVSGPEPVYCGDLDFGHDEKDPSGGDLALISDAIGVLGDYRVPPLRPIAEEYDASRNRQVNVEFTDEEKKRLELLNIDVHDWAVLELVPSKTTVSEMKRLLSEEPQDEMDEQMDLRAVNMLVRESDQKWKDAGYTASQLGTILHSAWQYIDFTGLLKKDASPDWNAVLSGLCDYGMIEKDQIGILMPFAKNMQMFLQSELCRRMTDSEKRPESGPYREIPFALAWPNEKEEFSLVQGMIDCWFLDSDGQAVLIDYKSDRINGTVEEKKAEIKKRYQVQLDMYAQAITAATGKTVKEKIIWLIRDGLAFDLCSSDSEVL